MKQDNKNLDKCSSNRNKRNDKGFDKKTSNKDPKYADRRNKKPGSEESSATIESSNAPWFWNRGIDFNEATRVPFDKLIGQRTKITQTGLPATLQSRFDYANSSVSTAFGMRLNMRTAIGLTQDYSDPVNRRINDLYATLLALRTSDLDFQQADLGLFLINYAQIGGYIEEARRALAVSYTYSRNDLTWPQGMLQLLRFDPTSIIGLQDDLLIQLNDIITDYNSFTVPDFLAIGDRFTELGANLYRDSITNNNGSQYYAFVNEGFYMYDDTPESAEDVNKLVFESLEVLGVTDPDTGLINMQRYLYAIQGVLGAWRNSSDFASIRGAVLNAFNKGAIEGSPITKSFAVLFEAPLVLPLDSHLLATIHNTMTINSKEVDIYQDPARNVIIHDPYMDTAATDYQAENLEYYCYNMSTVGMDAINGDVSPDNVMISSLMMPTVSDRGTGAGVLFDMGTEVISSFEVFYVASNPSNNNAPVISKTGKLHTFMSVTSEDGSIKPAAVREIYFFQQLLSQFAYAPRLIICSAAKLTEQPQTSGFSLKVYATIWNVDTLTQVSSSQLQKLHASQMRSVFTPYSSSKK